MIRLTGACSKHTKQFVVIKKYNSVGKPGVKSRVFLSINGRSENEEQTKAVDWTDVKKGCILSLTNGHFLFIHFVKHGQLVLNSNT